MSRMASGAAAEPEPVPGKGSAPAHRTTPRLRLAYTADGVAPEPPDPFTTLREACETLARRSRRRRAQDGPSSTATRRQRELGKLTARERIDLLVGEGSFV